MGQARINRSNKPKPEANRSAKDATENHQRPRRFAWNPRVILAFDIITQEFREVPFPDEERPNSVVGSLNGRLCVFNTSYDLRDDFWVMNEYGVASSWTRIRISLLYRLMKSGPRTVRRFFWRLINIWCCTILRPMHGGNWNFMG
ncbi:unnamed protein product [Brassica rapa]|uniref:F-box associated domain-containing protein n=1 Tax=Brassica campestris TaxID=3711 RepID=A0A3P5ZPS4_BRACM|nr:unnamed protein product [Brassica rapa]VDC80069.1 unnamed protein product [Brassica rapa]